MKGWTNALLLFVCASLAGVLGTSQHCIPPDMREWMKEERLRTCISYDTLEWTYTDLLCSLTCLESKWHTRASWGPFISDYLRIHEHCIDNLVSRTSPLFVVDYAPDRAGKDPYSLSVPALHGLMSRIVMMRRSIGVRSFFKVRPIKVNENHQWKAFADKEARHLTTRAFRNTVSATTWELLLRPSERDREEYARKSTVSGFGCVNKGRSLDVLDAIGDLCTYKDADALLKDKRTKDSIALCFVHAMCMATYNMPFKEYFVVMGDHNIIKHKKAIREARVPLIIQRSGRYDVCWKNTIHVSIFTHFVPSVS